MKKSSSYQYQNISSFGYQVKDLAVNNPLSYCLSTGMDNSFMHGGHAGKILNRGTKPCQSYISEYCSNNWDEYCELESKNDSRLFNSLNTEQNTLTNATVGLTAGEVLMYNTASKKYVIRREGTCKLVSTQFDPTVASSPMFTEWVGGNGICNTGCGDNTGDCVPVYGVNPATINSDPLMNKILDKPTIAIDILKKIYVGMKKDGTLSQLKGTRLGSFFEKNIGPL
jgi:hypothetical protein